MGTRLCFVHPVAGATAVEAGPGELIVGRSGTGADVELRDPMISRRHGRVWTDAGSVWYEDLGSSNGSWMRGERLSAPVCLGPGVEVRLGGETWLRIEQPGPALELPQGLELRLEATLGPQGFTDAVGQTTDAASRYVSALYSLTEGLLRSEGLDFLPETVQRVKELVPSAQRLALVAWPPTQDGSFQRLDGSDERVTISSSLARYAVQEGRALLLSPATMPKAVADSPSILLQRIQGAAYIPLQSAPGENIVGLLCVDTPVMALPITTLDFQFLCAVAGLLAGKVTSERLREQTRQQALETQRIEARREGLAAFLQIASHDLKNPLTAIDNCARLLRRVPPEKHPPLIEIILSASGRATNLIRTYLDAAALESGKPLEVTWEHVDMRALVDAEMEFVRNALLERMRGIKLRNEVDCPPIRGDARKLGQVVTNLLTNAVKYSPEGGEVVVGGAVLEGEARFWVQDRGVGISPEDQKRLFAAFQRVGDRALAPGTGLGLWLTAAIVEAHGGRLGVTSVPGEGSTFWFALPHPDSQK
jgi:signal transduction histidine kinase